MANPVALSLNTADRDDKRALVGLCPMLPEEKSLPGSQEEFTVGERDGFRTACESHFDVARHVVWPFVGMGKMGIVFWNEPLQEVFKISAGGRIGVFHQDEAAACMLAEDGERAVLETG